VTWDGLSWFLAPAPPAGPPDPPATGYDTTGIHVGDQQLAIVTGTYWYGGTTYTVPNGTVGWFSNHGIHVAAHLGRLHLLKS
jgi:hypothetical protein